MTPVARALVVFEARLMLRNPILWASAIMMLVWRTFATWRLMPAWHIETVQTATAAMLVGAGAAIATNLAALRDGRPSVAESLAALPARRSVRTLAVTLAGPAVAGLVVALVFAIHLLSLLIGSTPAGRFDAYEVATGVAVTALMAALGVALARWAPSMIAAPTLIVVLVWAIFQTGRNWLMPIVPIAGAFGDFSRPSGWHLSYVAALLVAVGGLGLLRHGFRPISTGVAGIAVVAVLLTGTMTLAQPEAGKRIAVANPERVCVPLHDVRYCAYPSFAQWIPLWQAAADPVARAVPPALRGRLPPIVQVSAADPVTAKMAESTIMTGFTWGRNGDEATDRRSLAARMAAAAVGLGGDELVYHDCDLRGQGRGIIAIWLAAQAGEPPSRFAQNFAGKLNHRSDLGFIDFGDGELRYARRLLAMPEAARRVRDNWSRLVSPATTTGEALSLLGLEPQSPPEKPRNQSCP